MAGKNLKKRNHLNKSKLINHHDRVDSLLKSEEEKVRTMKMKKKKEIEMKFEKRLLKYEELPDYMKDNEFILDYYRSEWPLKETFRSIFLLHNETLNIWTHLGGFFIFLTLTVLSLMETPPDVVIDLLFFDFSRIRMIRMPLMMMMKNASEISSSTVTQAEQRGLVFEFKAEGYHNKVTNIPRWPLLVFLIGAMGCLICSSISHLLACHSRRLNLFFWRLDYAGISLMIVCSFFAPIYYAFFCHPISLFFYLSSITLLGILVIITLLAPVLSSPQFRSFRATLFLTMGFSGVVPAAHALLLHWEHNQIFVALAYELAMAIFYAIGVVFYVSRIPERWKPGAFDIAGHSHQIFHVFVVAGALAHCGATLVLLEWRLNSPMCQIS